MTTFRLTCCAILCIGAGFFAARTFAAALPSVLFIGVLCVDAICEVLKGKK